MAAVTVLSGVAGSQMGQGSHAGAVRPYDRILPEGREPPSSVPKGRHARAQVCTMPVQGLKGQGTVRPGIGLITTRTTLWGPGHPVAMYAES